VCVIITPHTQTATRGTVNGIGQSLVAIGRSIGPLIGAPLFAWSANTGRWAIIRLTNVVIHIVRAIAKNKKYP